MLSVAPWDNAAAEERERTHNKRVTMLIVKRMRKMNLKTASGPEAARTRAALAHGHYYVPVVFCMPSIVGYATVSVYLDPRDDTMWRAILTEDLEDLGVRKAIAQPKGEPPSKQAKIRITLDADKWAKGLQQVWTDEQLAEALVPYVHVNGVFGSIYISPSRHGIMRSGGPTATGPLSRRGTLGPLYVEQMPTQHGCKRVNEEEGGPHRMWAYDMARRILKGQLPITCGIRGGLTGTQCLTMAADARLAHKRIKKCADIIECHQGIIKDPLDIYGQLLHYAGALETCMATVTLIENDPTFHALEIAPCQAAFVASLSDGLVNSSVASVAENRT